MSRALKVFAVSHMGIRIRVRVLPTTRDVHGEYLGGLPSVDGMFVHAFFAPDYKPAARGAGLIVLPLDGCLEELIPREVVHAVLHKMRDVKTRGDEAFATAVGVLSARIARKLGAMA